MTKRATPSGVPLSTMTVLMLAVFTVSVWAGVYEHLTWNTSVPFAGKHNHG